MLRFISLDDWQSDRFNTATLGWRSNTPGKSWRPENELAIDNIAGAGMRYARWPTV